MAWLSHFLGLHASGVRDIRATGRAVHHVGLAHGLAAPDELAGNRGEDEGRIAYVARHLDAVQEVIAEGVPVKGHFTWSLLDSYEWSLGYEKRFGPIHVVFNTLDRTPKASYHALAAALVRGGVT